MPHLDCAKKFWLLEDLRRSLFVQACFLTALIKLVLVTFGFATVRSFLAAVDRLPAGKLLCDEGELVSGAVWAVTAAGKLIPQSGTCLIRALVLTTLLRRVKIQSQLFVGVTKDPDNALTAHAWVVYADEVVIGRLADSPYQPLGEMLFDGASSIDSWLQDLNR